MRYTKSVILFWIPHNNISFLDCHFVWRSLDSWKTGWKKFPFCVYLKIKSFILLFCFLCLFSSIFLWTDPDRTGWTRTDPESHYWLLCFNFWQSYFIKLFDGGIQCEFIRTLDIYVFGLLLWVIYIGFFGVSRFWISNSTIQLGTCVFSKSSSYNSVS